MAATLSFVAPILNHQGCLDSLPHKGFDLGNGVLLQRTPLWFKNCDQLDDDVHLEDDQRNAEWCLSISYTPTLLSENAATSIMGAVSSAFGLANLALWLSKPNALGFDRIFQIVTNEGTPRIHNALTEHVFRPHFNDLGARLSVETLRTAKGIDLAIQDARKGNQNGAVWVASKACYKAITDSWWEGRYLLLWIGLEALFGPADGGEVSTTVAQRIAFFLANEKNSVQSKFRLAKKGYAWRSKIAHGRSLQKLTTHESSGALYSAEDFLQSALHKILLDNSLLTQFNREKTRDEFLAGLIFKHLPAV